MESVGTRDAIEDLADSLGLERWYFVLDNETESAVMVLSDDASAGLRMGAAAAALDTLDES